MVTQQGASIPGQGLPRRRFLAAMGAAAASAMAGGSAPARARRIIDVHTHYLPTELSGQRGPPQMKAWTLSKHLDDMHRAGVTRSLRLMGVHASFRGGRPAWMQLAGCSCPERRPARSKRAGY